MEDNATLSGFATQSTSAAQNSPIHTNHLAARELLWRIGKRVTINGLYAVVEARQFSATAYGIPNLTDYEEGIRLCVFIPLDQIAAGTLIPATETGLPATFTPERDTQDTPNRPRALKSKIPVPDEVLEDLLIGRIMGIAAHLDDGEYESLPDDSPVFQKMRAAIREYAEAIKANSLPRES